MKLQGVLPWIQLFAGWAVLNILTFLLVLVPHSARFLGIAPDIHDSEKYVIYGLWVLVEIILFFILLSLATFIVCISESVPANVGFIHLLVDPVAVTMVITPYVLIHGIPHAHEIRLCLSRGPHLRDVLVAAQVARNVTFGSGSVVWKATKCIEAELALSGINVSALEENSLALDYAKRHLVSWVAVLQVSCVIPPLLRFFHFHWKASWNSFLLAGMYFLLQGMDLAAMVQIPTLLLRNDSDHVIIMGLICFDGIVISAASMAACIPPLYLGERVSKVYNRTIAIIGIFLIDLPFLAQRTVLLQDDDAYLIRDGAFYVFLLKEFFLVLCFFFYLIRRFSFMLKDSYHSLNSLREEYAFDDPVDNDDDDEDDELEHKETEEYV